MNSRTQIRVNIENDRACVTTADGRFHIAADGGGDALPGCPAGLMLGALGSCIMLTLRAVAHHKKIDLGTTHVCLDYHTINQSNTRFVVDVTLDDRLTDREQKILFRSAQLCEVGKILKSDVCIEYHLTDTDLNSPL